MGVEQSTFSLAQSNGTREWSYYIIKPCRIPVWETMLDMGCHLLWQTISYVLVTHTIDDKQRDNDTDTAIHQYNIASDQWSLRDMVGNPGVNNS